MCETTDQNPTLRLERQTCGRCGGSGKYSYCQMYGDRCFGCQGRGEVLTKRGAAAAQYLIGLRSKPAGEVQVGDVIEVNLGRTRWGNVLAVKPDTMNVRCFENGVEQPRASGLLNIETDKLSIHGLAPASLVRVAQSKERELETLRMAVEYQGTLTKQGKPRKSAKK